MFKPNGLSLKKKGRLVFCIMILEFFCDQRMNIIISYIKINKYEERRYLIRLGLLHHEEDPRKVKKAYAFAAVAIAEGTELIYFTLRGVNFEKRRIKGYIYKEGRWQESRTDFPDVIFNTGSPQKFARRRLTLEKLKQQIPFTTSALGNKMSVYNRLVSGEFKPYLIPTEPLQSFQHLLSCLQQYNRLIIKPVNGHRGIGVIYIEKNNNIYILVRDGHSQTMNTGQLNESVAAQLKKTKMLVQPYINCRTQTGQVFDFRLHVQKDGRGEWVITAIYPRIGAPGNIVSNIHMGGSTNYLQAFLEQEFGGQVDTIKTFLENFALRMAWHLDHLQYQLFQERLDEIGIDIGLDDQGRYWLFEVNWRPGCPPAFDLELDVVKNMVHYAMYLARNAKKTGNTG